MNFISIILPQIESMTANKRLSEKAKEGNIDDLKKMFSETEKLENLNEYELKNLYEYEFTRKKGFEDKAKTNVLGVTVVVSLIMGSYTMIQNIMEKYENNGVTIISVVLFTLSVIYMLFAGVTSINVITEQVLVHKKQYGLKEIEDRKKDYYLQIACNRARNLIRNNLVSSSYRCIRNSLILLLLVMMIAIFPINPTNNTYDNENIRRNPTIWYSENCFDTVDCNVTSDYVEEFIIGLMNKGLDANKAITVIDKKTKTVVKFSGNKDDIKVYYVEQYVEP